MKTLYLVTGAAGYLGGEVCRQLVARGLQGRALVLPGDKTAQYIPKQIEQCVGDLCDTASLEKFFQVEPDTETIVLHCASMVALGNERRELVMKVNVQGTQNIIDQCFAHKECKKLIYVGSTGSIPELPHGQRMKEPAQFVQEESLGVYGQSKAMASQRVLNAAKSGLNACIVMPSGILGPGDAACGPVTSGLLMQMRGEVSVGLKGTFNLCDVRDLANGIFLAVEKGKAGESYILANEIDLLDLCETNLSVYPQIKGFPFALMTPLYDLLFLIFSLKVHLEFVVYINVPNNPINIRIVQFFCPCL